MTMLLKNSSESITEPKQACTMDVFPLSETDDVFPRGTPRVLSTHYRLDVLPEVFHNRKTVVVIRNPKDAAVSDYHFYKQVIASHFEDEFTKLKARDLSFSDYLWMYMYDHDQPFSTYFDFTKAMWDMAKDNPNFLVIFYEDLKKIPVNTIARLDKFMGTNCSLELINQIADLTSFSKMREAKSKSQHNLFKKTGEPKKRDPTEGSVRKYYRKGVIGDWKNHFTVADNEVFDAFLDTWSTAEEISYTYE